MGKKRTEARKRVQQKTLNTKPQSNDENIGALIQEKVMGTLQQIIPVIANDIRTEFDKKNQIILEKLLGLEQKITEEFKLDSHDLYVLSNKNQALNVGYTQAKKKDKAEDRDFVTFKLYAKEKSESFNDKAYINRRAISLNNEPYEVVSEIHNELLGLKVGATKEFERTITEQNEAGEEVQRILDAKIEITGLFKAPELAEESNETQGE